MPGWTRRALLIGGGLLGGGLALGVIGVGGLTGALALHDRRAHQAAGLAQGSLVALWIAVHPDGRVRVLSPHTEMGQGSQTGLLQIVLDELDADPARTTVEQAPADTAFANGAPIAGIVEEMVFGEELAGFTKRVIENGFHWGADLASLQMTGGSTAVRFTGWKSLRPAAAAARGQLVAVAARRLGVPASELTTFEGTVVHEASQRALDYGELADEAAREPAPSELVFKPVDQRRYIGRSHPRVDLPDKVFGQAEYGIDVAVEGMRYAAVKHADVVGATVTGVSNLAAIQGMPGVERVVLLDEAVAVVADKPWRAEKAVRAAEVVATSTPEQRRSTEQIEDAVREALQGSLGTIERRGDVDAAFAQGEVIEAEYIAPFLAAAPMEPLNATVWEEDGLLHVAAGAQNPLSSRARAAHVAGRPLDEVVFHARTMGGGFGRRGGLGGDIFNWLDQAVQIQAAAGGAVKMIWSREADIRGARFRPLDIARFRAVLGDDGLPVAWEGRTYAQLTEPAIAVPRYRIPSVRVQAASEAPFLPFAFWRSVDASTHGFFVESFVDELAAAAGRDPLDYRLALLDPDSREARVLREIRALSGWDTPPAAGRARGVALFPSFGSIIAQVAEVSAERGRPRVHHVWAVVDCGTVVNPDAVEAQIQGGIHFGLSAALHQAITLDGGVIEQSNFHDFRAVTFRDAPRITVKALETPGVTLGGIGEVGVPPIAPAVANALAALGDRRRRLPLLG